MKLHNSKITKLSVHERRLRWLGHVQRMGDDRTAKQVQHWTPEERRKRDWPRVTWQHVIIKDTEKGGLSWQEALSLAADRREWRKSPNMLFTGITKV